MDSNAQQVDDRLIRLENVGLAIPSRILLEGADASFAQGTLTALVGRNGSGKSTLLRAIAGLNPNYTGRILIDGRDRLDDRQRARLTAFVNTGRVRIANMRCRDVVALGRAPYTDWIGSLRKADIEAVDRALDTVGMADYASRTIDTLSDGECQRVMIARALAQDTPAILLDEPTSFLDIPNRHHLMNLLRQLAEEQRKCIILSTHELDIALSTAHQIALIDAPRLQLLSTSDQSTPSRISQALGL